LDAKILTHSKCGHIPRGEMLLLIISYILGTADALQGLLRAKHQDHPRENGEARG